MSKQSDHFYKGCLITLFIVCAIPIILFIFIAYDMSSNDKGLEEVARSETSEEVMSSRYNGLLPEYEVEKISTVKYPDEAFSVTLRFTRTITAKDIKSLKKLYQSEGLVHMMRDLGNGRYDFGGLILEIGSDTGEYENYDPYNRGY